MMPLIDVVFLLLTFFIYAMVVMVELKSSGVELISVEGAGASVSDRVVLVEVDGRGGVLIDGRAVADDELDAALRELAGRADAPPVVVAMQDVKADVDRGPIHQSLLARISRAGVKRVSFPKLEAGSGVSR